MRCVSNRVRSAVLSVVAVMPSFLSAKQKPVQLAAERVSVESRFSCICKAPASCEVAPNQIGAVNVLGESYGLRRCLSTHARRSGTMTASTVKNSPMLDPDIRRLLDTVFAAPPGAAPPDVEALRAAAEEAPRRLGGEPEALGRVEDAQVPGPAGSIPVRIYRPDAAAAAAARALCARRRLGDRLARLARSAVPHTRAIAARSTRRGRVPLRARTRLSGRPRRLRSRMAVGARPRRELRADGERFAVAGDSSGGNLAAALTLRLRASRAPQPQLQLLLYPALDATCSRASYREFATGYNLAGAQMAWYWDVYRAGAAAEAPELSPLAARELSGLAPAVVAIAEADVLRDDGLDYARRLGEAGVPVRVIRCEGMIHGFLRWTGEVAAARRWIDAIAAATHEVLGPRAA